ncbi:TonB-dependent receptor [Sphingomicrobium nitratireducens]|uniref:TonB-dependent receptor n=1 Tax=Sphingomicrobium nitratireducens TaxID=2964666 RepID=UPI00223FDD7A|nr:TonB-dependent receptor [Sphingomicrobium nitratireducens]
MKTLVSRRSTKFLIGASIAALAAMPATAYAQDPGGDYLSEDAAQEANDDVIVVTGIRQSLKDAMDLKREAQGIVDAITAEDVGKFPDTNLAESLQRITGVSIDRANGEGQFVTVRGFGPEFNLVTLNGRQMPTSTLGDCCTPPSSRSFDFANLAAESIARVEVYKSGRASVPSGGIGSLINIHTGRPLDAPGFRGSVGVKGVYDTSRNDGNPITPEISAIFSDTFADDKVGIMLSGTYQDRKASVNSATVGEWRGPYYGWENDWGTLNQAGVGITNDPGDGDLYSVPQNGNYDFLDIDRERLNGQAVLQFRPIDGLTATADYTFARTRVEAALARTSIWFNHGNTTSSWTDGPLAGPLFYSETFDSPSDFSYQAQYAKNETELNSLGLNLEYEIFNGLTLFADFHDSSSETGPRSPYGTDAIVSTAILGIDQQTINFEGEVPIISVVENAGSDPYDPSGVFATGNSFRNGLQRTDIQQYQAGGTWEFDSNFLDSVDFGFSKVENEVRSAYGFIQQDSWGGAGPPSDLPDDLFTVGTVTDKFSGLDESSDVVPIYLKYDFAEYVDLIKGLYNTCGGPSGSCLAPYQYDSRVKEDTTAAYIEANLEFYAGTVPVNVHAGVRYEETKITSNALSPIPTGEAAWVGTNEFAIYFEDEADFTELTGEYDYWLPAIDFDIEPVDDVKLRASWSKTLARPNYANLQGGISVASNFNQAGGIGARGAPDLLPYLSKNIDLSAEWYYDDASYLAVGFFHKNVSNFITTTTVFENYANLPHPLFGPRADAARAAVADPTDVAEVREWIFQNACTPDTCEITGTNIEGFTTGRIFGIPGEDQPISFALGVPVNSDQTAKIHGWEFALQHNFWDTGFGVILNYTIVKGDAEYDDLVPDSESQFALTGLSDSANVVAFYDKNGFQARLAYNWRDKFFGGIGSTYAGNFPYYIEDYGQLDASMSYEVTSHITVFGEAINLLGDDRRGHRRNDRTLNFYQEGKPRFALGARYKF